MKKYIASIIGGALFVGFVAYATVQTQPKEEKELLNQEVTVLEDIKPPSSQKIVLPKKLPSSNVLSASVVASPVVPVIVNSLQPENIEKDEYTKKYREEEDDRYEKDEHEDDEDEDD